MIAGCWTLVGVMAYANSWLLIGDLLRMGKLEGAYPFLPDFAATVVIGLVAGALGGYLLVYKLSSGRQPRSPRPSATVVSSSCSGSLPGHHLARHRVCRRDLSVRG